MNSIGENSVVTCSFVYTIFCEFILMEFPFGAGISELHWLFLLLPICKKWQGRVGGGGISG